MHGRPAALPFDSCFQIRIPSGLMVMVGRTVIFTRGVLMAGRTNSIPLVLQFSCVRVVTIRATDSFVVHLALDKRSIHIDLIQNLPISVIQASVKQSQLILL